MFFDQFGRPLATGKDRPPQGGMQIIPELSDRESFYLPGGLTPARVRQIMESADSGDVSEQCKLCREVLEKSHDIATAVSTRRDALTACKYEIIPGDDTKSAQMAAKCLKSQLDATGKVDSQLGLLSSFDELLDDLSDALLPGFAVSEIIWKPGGAGFEGFKSIEQRFFTFTKSMDFPRLRVSSCVDGAEIPTAKIIFHRQNRSSDPARGGLIRPLAWLYCFANLNLKDLLSFLERYGMPFVVAKVDQTTRESMGTLLERLICSFGPNGGGIIDKNTELELLQASNSSGDVYFRLLEYMRDAITRVILGQTASSSDGGGLSKDNAQTLVRYDILCADARKLEKTINRDLFAVWTKFNCADGVASPKLHIMTEQPEDTSLLADTLVKLATAGFEAADETEISARVGIKMVKKATEFSIVDNVADSADAAVETDKTLNLKSKYDAMGVAIRAGLLTATPEIESQVRAELGLPAMTDEVKRAWEATGGIRQPITLKSSESAAVEEALEMSDQPDLSGRIDAELSPEATSALESFVAPFQEHLAELLSEDISEEEFKAKLQSMELAECDPQPLAELIESETLTAYAKTLVKSGNRLAVDLARRINHARRK